MLRQRVIQGGDLAPVGRLRRGCFGVQGADGRLHLVGPRIIQGERLVQQGNALLNFSLVPAGAVLFVEQDDFARRIQARLAA